MSVQGLRGGGSGRGSADSSMYQQPDSLASLCSLHLLKHLHLVAEDIESVYGDKSAEKTQFIVGIQGKVSRYVTTFL